MSAYEKYSLILDGEYSIDYWSDQAIFEAIKLLNDFDDDNWDELTQRISGKTYAWQTRCAETLSEATSERALNVLIRLLHSVDMDVVEAAVDSLHSLAQAEGFVHLTDEETAILSKLADRSGLIGLIASRLLKR